MRLSEVFVSESGERPVKIIVNWGGDPIHSFDISAEELVSLKAAVAKKAYGKQPLTPHEWFSGHRFTGENDDLKKFLSDTKSGSTITVTYDTFFRIYNQVKDYDPWDDAADSLGTKFKQAYDAVRKHVEGNLPF